MTEAAHGAAASGLRKGRCGAPATVPGQGRRVPAAPSGDAARRDRRGIRAAPAQAPGRRSGRRLYDA